MSLAYRQDDSTMNFSQQRKRKDTPEKDNNHIDQEKKLSVQSSKKLTVQPRPLSFFAGISIIIYVLCFLCARHYHRGSGEGLYTFLWVSNFSLLMGALGMILQNSTVIGTSVACVAFSHLAWNYDLFHWMVFNTIPIGRLSYIIDDEYDDIWWTTLHPLWYVPLCFAVLYCDYPLKGLELKCWYYATLINLICTLLTRFWCISDNSSYCPNLNTSHEFVDVNTETFLHHFDNSSIIVYLLWRCLWDSVLLNGVCFLFLKVLAKILLEPSKVHIEEKQQKQM